MTDITLTLTEAEAERFRDACEFGTFTLEDAATRLGKYGLKQSMTSYETHAAALRELAGKMQPRP